MHLRHEDLHESERSEGRPVTGRERAGAIHVAALGDAAGVRAAGKPEELQTSGRELECRGRGRGAVAVRAWILTSARGLTIRADRA